MMEWNMPANDPDASVVALFLNMAVKNEAKSASAGRPIFEDLEVCQLRYPGSKNIGVYPATGFSHWATDPQTGEQFKVSYAERFARQYRQFKEHAAQTKAGTPLSEVAFLTEARRAELRALNVYTVEALAALDGLELKNLGHNGRDLKNRAIEYLEAARDGAHNTQLMAELEALRARNSLLEEDVSRLKEELPSRDEPDDDFRDMSLEQLRDYITDATGHPPRGTLNRRTLLRMARELKSPEVTA
jgi:hypothetical protein